MPSTKKTFCSMFTHAHNNNLLLMFLAWSPFPPASVSQCWTQSADVQIPPMLRNHPTSWPVDDAWKWLLAT